MRNETGIKAILLLPALILFVIFTITPIIMAVYYGFQNWDGFSSEYQFIGFENYKKALLDKKFIRAISVTFFIAIVSTVVVNILGISMAILVSKQSKSTTALRSIIFFPLLLSPVIVGFLWQTILNNYGILNRLMEMMGLSSINLLGDPNGAVLSITGIVIWQTLGFNMVIYLAGLQTIPTELYEAVKIDGASAWQAFRNITFPMLAPAFTMNVILAITGGMKEYDRVASLTNGGPGGSSSTIAFLSVGQAIKSNNFSYASSLAVYLLLTVAILGIGTTLYLRKREEKIT